jgi:hypothetical protein
MWFQSAAMVSSALIVLLFAQGGQARWRSFAGPLLGLALGILSGVLLAARFGVGAEQGAFPKALVSAVCGCAGGMVFAGRTADKRAPQ